MSEDISNFYPPYPPPHSNIRNRMEKINRQIEMWGQDDGPYFLSFCSSSQALSADSNSRRIDSLRFGMRLAYR